MDMETWTESWDAETYWEDDAWWDAETYWEDDAWRDDDEAWWNDHDMEGPRLCMSVLRCSATFVWVWFLDVFLFVFLAGYYGDDLDACGDFDRSGFKN